MTSFYTYFHTRNDNGAVFYVGKGRGRRADSTTRRNQYWENITAKHGRTVHIAAHWPTEFDALEHERFLILCFRGMGVNICNMTDGGDGSRGLSPTAETRAKLSSATKGIPKSAEHCAKISAGKKGIPKSADHRRKIGISSTGRTHTEEARAKISAAQKGKKTGPQSAAHIAKLSAIRKGRVNGPMSAEHRANISAAAIRRHVAHLNQTLNAVRLEFQHAQGEAA